MSDETVTNFQFRIQPDSATPPEQQLVAQLKITIMLGTLKPGQKLPSVRSVEKQTGIGRNVVWRAYTKLANSGILTIRNRRDVVVTFDLDQDRAGELVKVFEWLAGDVLERLSALKINPQSFVRFLQHRIEHSDVLRQDIVFSECNSVQTRRWAREISEVWGLPIPGVEIRQLRQLPPDQREGFRKILTPLYHQEEVAELFPDGPARVIALRLDWKPSLIEDFRSLPEGSCLALLLERSECAAYGEPFARELKGLCPNLQVEVVPWQNGQQLRELVEEGKYARIFLSGIVQEALSDEIPDSPLVVDRALTLNRRSLEEARVRAGIVL